MDLNDLNEQLYRSKKAAERPKGPPPIVEPGQARQSGENFQMPAGWTEEQAKINERPVLTVKKRMNWTPLIAGVSVLIVVAAGLWFFLNRNSFDTSKVSLVIQAQNSIVSGQQVDYSIQYQNLTKVTLKNVKLTFSYPENSQPLDQTNVTIVNNASVAQISLPDIGPGQSNKITLSANVMGAKDELKKATAKLDYEPSNISSQFENAADFTSSVFSVPIVVDFDLPDKVASGQPLTVALKYLNTSSATFSDLIISAQLPADFVISSSSPAADQGISTWHLTEISPNEEGSILISGVMNGVEGQVESFKAALSSAQETSQIIAQGSASTQISASPLSLTLSLGGSRDTLANVGDDLRYALDYKNNSDVPIGPVYVVVKFDSKVIDYKTLDPGKGQQSGIDNSITWNESTVPELALLQPGQEGTLDFSVKVKTKLPIAAFSDKNFLINATAKIDSNSIPMSLVGTQISGSDVLIAKLNSRLSVSAEGYYKDMLIPNSGPIPPAVGQQTTYTIYWRVVNLSNDVDNVVVQSYLPAYVSWLGVVQPNGADIKYDQATGKVTWNVGKMNANSGVLTAVQYAAFKIGFTPNINQSGSKQELIQDSTISGTDLFTGASLTGTDVSVQTDLPDDPSIGLYGGIVR